eukprot:GILJ01011461.1.p1 GENE.GILJ01011461.1~~GILJ01011461.1.p1  ORF type:complete len:113 (-),score=24.80 GILJ01011461.1:357-665(-)
MESRKRPYATMAYQTMESEQQLIEEMKRQRIEHTPVRDVEMSESDVDSEEQMDIQPQSKPPAVLTAEQLRLKQQYEALLQREMSKYKQQEKSISQTYSRCPI